MSTQRPFMWLAVQSSHSLFGSVPRPVFEWVSSIKKSSADGTLGLTVGNKKIGGSGLLRWISRDRVLLTMKDWTPSADRQRQQRGCRAGNTNLDGWTGRQRAWDVMPVSWFICLLLTWGFWTMITRLIVSFLGFIGEMIIAGHVLRFKDITGCFLSTGVSWGPDRRLDVVVTMVPSGWGAWALSPCGLVLVICSSVCLSQEPHIKPADCSRKEHPVVSYQGECVSTTLLFFQCDRDFFLSIHRNWGTLVKKIIKNK